MQNDEIKEILEHLKEYLQNKIDNGEHKIFYNDLMWDEKTIDCINAIDDTLDYITNLQQENERLKVQVKKDNHILGCNFASKDKYKQRYEDYKSRCEKVSQVIDEMLIYDEFSDTTRAFGNVARELKFYLSNCNTLEQFDKLQNGSDSQ